MQIISELAPWDDSLSEAAFSATLHPTGREGATRDPYAGCVGYFSFNGNLDTCITIRTALLKDGKAYVQAGGGWVNDSEPEAEFQETVNKSKAMLKAVALAETFAETP